MDKISEEMFIRQSKELSIDINSEQIRKFYKYMQLLLEWNEKINLTAITEEKEIISKHFIDSLTILKYIKEDDSIVDIGTGAGFPGIPISIINNNKISLVDSLNKRINFLEILKDELELKNIKTIHSRAEDFGQNNKYRETFDIAVSRAVANLTVLVEYLIPTVKPGGRIICMKGSKIKDELEEAKYAIETLGGKISICEEIELPETDIKRNILIIDKIKKTPNKYPRKAGTPSKNPLKSN